MSHELGEIKSHVFSNKIIVAIDSRWLDYFNSQNPIFKASIQDGKYVLVGPKVSNLGPTDPETTEVDDSG